MATSANAAFQTWRQFSGDAKAPVHMNLRTPGVANYQADIQAGPTVGDQLTNFAQAAGNFFQAKTSYDQSAQKKADAEVNAWMARHTMAEYRQKMREGNVPFQNDPVAMDVLHNNAAYGIALEVEEAIQNKVRSGSYKTLEEADKARIEALEGARSEYSLSMGISPDNKAFRTGFNRDEEKRRQMLVGLQTDVTDKYLRTQGKVNAMSAVLGPLTDDFVAGVNPQTVAAYVVGTIKQQHTLGQIRSDQDIVEAYSKTVESLKGTKGGAAAIEALGQQKVSLFGVESSLRDHLGGGVFDAAHIGAMVREQGLDADRQNVLNDNILKWTSTNDIGGALAERERLVQESGGVMTPGIATVNQAIGHIQQKMARENAAARVQFGKDAESLARQSTAMETLRLYVSGEADMASINYTDMGLKDRAEASVTQQRFLASISDPVARFKATLKIAAADKDGFASNALQTKGAAASSAWTQYTLALGRGDATAVLPEKVKEMQALYESDPQSFTGVYPDQPYIQAMELSRQTGATTEDVAKGQIEWKRLPQEQQKIANDALLRQVNRTGARDPAYVTESIKLLAAPYLQMGVPADEAVKLARGQFDGQTEKVMDYPIHKSFFQLNADKSTTEQGKSTFDLILPEVRKELGKDIALSYDRGNQTVYVHDLQTGDSRKITNMDLQAKAQQLAKEAEAKKTAASEAEIKAQTTATTRNRAQQESMNRLSGVNFYK